MNRRLLQNFYWWTYLEFMMSVVKFHEKPSKPESLVSDQYSTMAIPPEHFACLPYTHQQATLGTNLTPFSLAKCNSSSAIFFSRR